MQDRIREESAQLQQSPEAHDVAQSLRASELQHEERRLRMRQSQSFKMESGRDSRREEQIERKRKGNAQETRSAAASDIARARDQEADSGRLSYSYPLQQQSDDGHRDSPIEELQRAVKNLVQHVHMAEIERKLGSRSSSRGSNLTPQGMVPASAPANGAAAKMWGGTTERGAEDDAPVKPEARRSRSFRDLSHSSRDVMEDSTDSAQDKKAQREARTGHVTCTNAATQLTNAEARQKTGFPSCIQCIHTNTALSGHTSSMIRLHLYLQLLILEY